MLPFGLLKDEDYFGALKSKILVVDDNSDVRKLVLHLRQSGYDAIEAATSLDALKQARAIRPDLILMDLAMLDGIEAIATLKTDPLTQDIPVIVGISTGTKFWNLSGPLEHQRYEPVNATDNLPSTSHAVVIVGYSDDLNGGSFIIANSLGPKWGDSGFGAFPYRCAIDIGEAWVIKNFAGVGI